MAAVLHRLVGWTCVDAGARSFQSERVRFYRSVEEAAAHDLNTVVCSSTLQTWTGP